MPTVAPTVPEPEVVDPSVGDASGAQETGNSSSTLKVALAAVITFAGVCASMAYV